MDSGIGELLRQLPTGIILMFCGSGTLLLIAIGYIITARNRRANQAVPPVTASAAAAEPADLADLPDLDMLSSTEMLQAEPEPEPIQTVPPVPVAAVEVPPVRATSGASQRVSLTEGDAVEAVEVLTVLRDVADGRLIIRIGEKLYRHPPAIADAEFKRQFNSTLRTLNGQPVVQPKPAPPAPKAPKVATSEFDAAEPLEAARLPNEPIPGDLPKFTLPDTPVKPKRGQRPVAEPIPEINIAAAIESYLQHKLINSAAYAGRSIHVRPALHGGVKIEVDGVFYDSVGEVADDDVREYLAATIAEWQARQ